MIEGMGGEGECGILYARGGYLIFKTEIWECLGFIYARSEYIAIFICGS